MLNELSEDVGLKFLEFFVLSKGRFYYILTLSYLAPILVVIVVVKNKLGNVKLHFL